MSIVQIDTSVTPHIPTRWNHQSLEGMTIEEHRDYGVINIDLDAAELVHAPKKEEVQMGAEGTRLLREELANKKPFNATMLDHLLENENRIPRVWEAVKGRRIFCVGTVYSLKGVPVIRGLEKFSDGWGEVVKLYENGWYSNSVLLPLSGMWRAPMTIAMLPIGVG